MAARKSAKPADPAPEIEEPAVEPVLEEAPPEISSHPVAASPPPLEVEDDIIDYVGFAAELTAVAEEAAGVLPDDTDEVRLEKLHQWNLNGGLLQAIDEGRYDIPSSVRQGNLSDSLILTDPVPAEVLTLEAGVKASINELTSAADLNTYDVVPLPNRQPWDAGVISTLNGTAVRWAGESWVEAE